MKRPPPLVNSIKSRLADALDRWIRSRKHMSRGTVSAYRVVVRKIKDWAALKGLKYLKEVTPALLDEWRGLWGR